MTHADIQLLLLLAPKFFANKCMKENGHHQIVAALLKLKQSPQNMIFAASLMDKFVLKVIFRSFKAHSTDQFAWHKRNYEHA